MWNLSSQTKDSCPLDKQGSPLSLIFKALKHSRSVITIVIYPASNWIAMGEPLRSFSYCRRPKSFPPCPPPVRTTLWQCPRSHLSLCHLLHTSHTEHSPHDTHTTVSALSGLYFSLERSSHLSITQHLKTRHTRAKENPKVRRPYTHLSKLKFLLSFILECLLIPCICTYHTIKENQKQFLPSVQTPCLNFIFRQNIKTFGIFSWSICNFKKKFFIQ